MVSSTLALAAERMREKTGTISGRIEKYALQEKVAGANLVWVWVWGETLLQSTNALLSSITARLSVFLMVWLRVSWLNFLVH
jgi:hypothetical protein